MSTCTDVRALLPLVVGGDLEDDQALVVTEHLEAGCAPCAAALRELQRVRGYLGSMPERSPAPSVDLWPDLRAALVSEGLVRSGAPVLVRRARVGARGTWLSAAAATLLVAGAIWSLQRGGEAPALPEAAPELAEGGVTTELAPTWVGGPELGGLRPLAPGETPFSLEAELFGRGAAGGPSHPHLLRPDPARPTLAGDRGGH